MQPRHDTVRGPEPTRFPTWIDLVAMLAIFFAATVVAAMCMYLLGNIVPGMQREVVNVIVYTLQFVLAIGGICAYRIYRGRRGVRIMDSPFRLTFKWYNSALVLAGIVLITAAGMVLEPLMNLFPDHWFERLSEAVGRGGWAVLMTVVLAPIFEETLFRGLILEPARQKWGATAGVMISAVMFGVVHAPILPQMLNAFVMGIVLGYIYVLTDSLVPVIVIHAINNAIAYILLEVTGTQDTDMRAIIGNDTVYWMVFGACAVIFVVSLVSMASRADNKTDIRTLPKKTTDDEV